MAPETRGSSAFGALISALAGLILLTSGHALAQSIQVHGTLVWHFNIEVRMPQVPEDACEPGEVLDRWWITENGRRRGTIFTFPDLRWIETWDKGLVEIELVPVCRAEGGIEIPRDAVARTFATQGPIAGDFRSLPSFADGPLRIREHHVREATAVGPLTVHGNITLIFDNVDVEADGVISAADPAQISLKDSYLKGTIIGHWVTIRDSTVEGLVQATAGVTIRQSKLTRTRTGPVLSAAGHVGIHGSELVGEVRIADGEWVDISDSRFTDAGTPDNGRSNLIELDCRAESGCSACEVSGSTFWSDQDDFELDPGAGSCRLEGSSLIDTYLSKDSGGLELLRNRFIWYTDIGYAVTMASVGPGATITDNTFRAPAIPGLVGLLLYGDPEDFHITGNAFCVPFPGGTAFQNLTAGMIDVTGNYWGHPTGPRWNQFPPTGGEGSFIAGLVDYEPFLTAGNCSQAFIERVELVQSIASTDLVAGKPAVLRVFPGNLGAHDIGGVAISGTLGGAPFARAGVVVHGEYDWAEQHAGEDSVDFHDLPLPEAGPGEARVRLHYLDPEFGFPVVQDRTLAYQVSPRRELTVGAFALDVSDSLLHYTLREQLGFLRATYPTHRVRVWKLAPPIGDGNLSYLLMEMWAALKDSDLDAMVGVTTGLPDFQGGWGPVQLIWPHQSDCDDTGSLGDGGSTEFALAHALGHAVAGATNQHEPGWEEDKKPNGVLVSHGWNPFLGADGLIHSFAPDDPTVLCDEYTSGDASHACNFFNFMARGCLPPKWVGPALRARLFEALDPMAGAAKAVEPVIAVPLTVWEDGTAALGRLYDIEGTPDQATEPGPWRVETRDGSGATLAAVDLRVALGGLDPDRALRFGGAGVLLPAALEVAEVVLLHEGQVVDAIARSGEAPTVTVLSPNGGRTRAGPLTASWSASDGDGDPLRFSLFVRCDGSDWSPVAIGVEGNAMDLDSADLAGGDACRMRVVASDGRFSASDESDATFGIVRHAPEVEILAPASGDGFEVGIPVQLAGLVSDLDGDALPPIGHAWRSDIDGALGSGPTLTVSTLGEGSHAITLAVTDSSGMTGEATVQVLIDAAVDSDGDGLPDWWETRWGTDIGVRDRDADPDFDGLTNGAELLAGTDPLTADSDSDGRSDGAELASGDDPLDPRSDLLFRDGFESIES